MQIETNFGGSEGVQMTLRHAILLYGDDKTTVATLHGVNASPGMLEPQLLEGAPLDRKEFLDIARRLSEQKHTGGERRLLDPTVLLADCDRLCWYRPSARRTWFWKTQNQDLNTLNGREALHPTLLFVAKEPRDLYVYALASDERPTLKTPIYRAPYWNIWQSGHLCEGAFKLPENFGIGGIARWESAFFDTHFSHPAGGVGALCKYAGGHTALWKAMAASGRSGANKAMKQFPVECLIRESRDTKNKGKKPLTLGMVINE